MNKRKLQAKIIEHGDTQGDLAGALGMSLSNFSLRINGKIEFRRSEIEMIKHRYNLNPVELNDIFFEDVVSE